MVRADAPSKDAGTQTNEQQARDLVERQVVAMRAEDDQKLAATFDATAMIMRPEPVDRETALISLRQVALGIDPHEGLTSVAVGDLTVRGTDRVALIDTVLDVTKLAADGTTIELSTRAVELATAATSWRVVAAVFAPVDEPKPRAGPSLGPVPGATAKGPLTTLLEAELAKQHPDMVIESVREATTGEWGVVQALVDAPHPRGRARFAVFLAALPEGPQWRTLALEVFAL